MSEVVLINVDQIKSNPYQPRQYFDDEKLNELAASIAESGLIQPIVVRSIDGAYEIVAGERRFKACQMLGWWQVPAIVMSASEQEMAKLALIENIQRDDLSPIEEANAYKQILRMTSLTQEMLANQVGKTQSSIANKIRLLNLSEETQQELQNKTITERHGRAMLHLTPKQQAQVIKEIKAKNLTVADTEKYIEKKFTYKKDESDNIRCFGVSTRIAINTIRQAFNSLKKVSVPAKLTESETDDSYIMTITIKK